MPSEEVKRRAARRRARTAQMSKRPGAPPDNDSFASNSYYDENRGKKGFSQAEDGSWVPNSYWNKTSTGNSGRKTVRTPQGEEPPTRSSRSSSSSSSSSPGMTTEWMREGAERRLRGEAVSSEDERKRKKRKR